MRLSVIGFMLFGVTLGLITSPALGDDLNPPAWRGQPGTTFGKWEFSTSDANPLPEPGYIYPWGLPGTTVTPGLFQSWMPEWGGRQGVWPLSGEIVTTIPNRPEPLPYKDIWVQLTWAQQAPNVFPTVSETRFGVASTIVQEIPLPDGWFHTTYQIHLEPNPDWERLLITGAVNVDEMAIDTICAPEPSTLCLLAMGTLAILHRRRGV
jgi:hypothetical protein